MSNCELQQIFLGEVASVQNYGAFVKIPGCSQQGLVHRTQISSVNVSDVGEVLQKGERVWCKVISIDDKGKIGLSMKLVDQGDGRDLDPNGVKLEMDERKRKVFVKTERKVIELQAVFNTTCTKCGTYGHLSKDCFMTPDGKKYELIPEFEEGEKDVIKKEDTDKVAHQPLEKESKEEEREMKKAKKSKKLKRTKEDSCRSSSSSSSEGSDTEDEKIAKRKRRKKSKERKSKKKKKSSREEENNSCRDKRKRSDKRSKKCKHSKSKH